MNRSSKSFLLYLGEICTLGKIERQPCTCKLLTHYNQGALHAGGNNDSLVGITLSLMRLEEA